MVSVNKTVPHSMRTKTDRRADCFPIEEPPSLHTLTSIWLDTFSPSRWTMFVKRSADIFFSLFGLILSTFGRASTVVQCFKGGDVPCRPPSGKAPFCKGIQKNCESISEAVFRASWNDWCCPGIWPLLHKRGR